MESIKLAIDMEKETIATYRELARICRTNEGIKNILMMLAEDHEKHLSILDSMRTKPGVEMEKTQAFREARKLFEEMHGQKETFSCDLDQLRLYKEARDLILKKEKFYAEMIEKTDSEEDKSLLQKLVEEEKKQGMVLDHIITMVERPKTWLEDAEFVHLDDY